MCISEPQELALLCAHNNSGAHHNTGALLNHQSDTAPQTPRLASPLIE